MNDCFTDDIFFPNVMFDCKLKKYHEENKSESTIYIFLIYVLLFLLVMYYKF
uniref:Uncharacterized protein n=1 Tax=viral metagenome TaxID=1070528 RepID=A0A6C0E9L7_9ZZZZ